MSLINIGKQRGVGLIEVLVTVMILATSLLAIGALQSRSLQFNHSAYLRSQANLLAYDILDRMRINSENLASYEGEYDSASPGGGGLAGDDLDAWMTMVTSLLPGGTAEIACESSVCTVSLEWIEEEERGAQVDPDAQNTTSFKYSTRL
ncbi:type IV pilus modification protein PilV [Marinimicrobium agarilyticum]|uniref:type IV pilus modification protein PilV n=1 Tax=Marinimicrobium agarilyticum TaxID=306546 RepID=UPI0006878098|nr:type IV pilus modification protein PilV [Marinimicrobium agarilyticum]